MRRAMTGMWWAAAVAMALLLCVDPVLAQDAAAAAKPAGGSKTSVFQMFFWVEDDIFGLIQIWILVFMSVWVMALVIQHAMANAVKEVIPKEAVAEYEGLLGEKKFREAIERAASGKSVFDKIMHASLSEASNGFGAMERAIEETADLEGSKRSRKMEMLNVLGAVGPMVGLFGTVYGMIMAFYAIVEKGGQPKPAELASGVATALVTTFWGLVVGIPAVAAVALIRTKLDGLLVEAMIQAEILIGQFQPATRKSSSGASATPAPAPAGAAPKPRPA